MSLLRVAMFAVISLALTAPAGAGGRVDWSDYIDPNPQKPVTVQPAVAKHEAPARGKTKKASRAKKKVGKSKAAAKARKKKARRK